MDTIGLFQLENLMISRSPFLFLDVRADRDQQLHPTIARHLAAAKQVKPAEALTYINSLKIDKQQPILMVCEDGTSAQKVARDLEAAGYANVYIVAGGVLGLLSEL